MVTPRPTLRGTRKQRSAPCAEIACEAIFRPLAHVLVLGLAPLRVPPPAVVLASTATGFTAAAVCAHGSLTAAAIVLQLKTVLDNADGQLARATNRITAFGRYLDSESDLAVNAAIFAALAVATGHIGLTAASFVALTAVLSIDYNLERLYRHEHGAAAELPPGIETRPARWAARLYDAVYAPQDRVVERIVTSRTAAMSARAREAYHDRPTLTLAANSGLSTQLLALGICLAAGAPTVYLFVPFACLAALILLSVRREVVANRFARRRE